jgi:hypothetical protein
MTGNCENLLTELKQTEKKLKNVEESMIPNKELINMYKARAASLNKLLDEVGCGRHRTKED